MYPGIVDLVSFLAYIPIGLLTIWCIRNFSCLQLEFRVLSIFVFFSAAVQGLAEVLAKCGINNMAVSHVYTLLGFLILTNFYKKILHLFIPQKLFFGLGFGFVLLAICTVLFWQPLYTFNSIPLTIQAIVMIIFAMSTFILTLNENLNYHLRQNIESLNWINSGIFIYFSGSLLLFFNGNVILHVISRYWGENTWLIHAFLSIVLHVCLLVGLWKSPKA